MVVSAAVVGGGAPRDWAMGPLDAGAYRAFLEQVARWQASERLNDSQFARQRLNCSRQVYWRIKHGERRMSPEMAIWAVVQRPSLRKYWLRVQAEELQQRQDWLRVQEEALRQETDRLEAERRARGACGPAG